MVKVERSSIAPASLEKEKLNKSNKYGEKDVIHQLKKDFNGKCYLCEIDKLQSAEVEHLKPHHGTDRDLMFDWNNLFYCCSHCNSMKNKKEYEENIIDCCKTEPEKYISQNYKEGHVSVKPLNDTKEAEVTAKLIEECFEKRNTGIREIECDTRVEALQETMNTLHKTLQKYKENPNKRYMGALRGMLNRGYKFAGFTRTYVREHIEDYPELEEYIRL